MGYDGYSGSIARSGEKLDMDVAQKCFHGLVGVGVEVAVSKKDLNLTIYYLGLA